MADAALYVAIAAAAASGVQTHQSGERQDRRSKRALVRQKKESAVARSAAASERLAGQQRAKEMRQRKPDSQAILAKAKQKRQQGETYQSGTGGVNILRGTRYLG